MALEQIKGVIAGAPPNVHEDVARGVLLKSLREQPIEMELMVKLAFRCTKEKFVLNILGCPLPEEDRAQGNAEYMDQRKVKCWNGTYNLFRSQGMTVEKAREAAERDPEYLRMKNLANATRMVFVMRSTQGELTRKEFFDTWERVKGQLKNGQEVPQTREQWEMFWELATAV